MSGYGMGSGIHMVRASVRARIGAMVKSFTASAIG
mgnify:CR=1 FL=1